MFNLLNFPYNLQEMMQDENEEITLASLEEKLTFLLKKDQKLTQEKLAAALGLNPHQWVEWLKNAPVSSGLKVKIKNLPDR
jgi:hypothetical protein